MKTLRTLSCMLLLCASAVQAQDRHPLAPSTLGLHLGSHHFSHEKGTDPLNNSNTGVYARWDNGLTVGTLRNPNSKQSVYAAWTLETPRWNNLTAAITVGGITGYDRPLIPLVAASVSVAVSKSVAVRLSVLPKAEKSGSAMAHLSAEWKF